MTNAHNAMLRLARLDADPAAAGNPWLAHEWVIGLRSTRRHHRAWLWLAAEFPATIAVRFVRYTARRG